MQTECIADIFGFEAVEGRQVVAAFDGGAITSDAGALLLGATDRAIRMVDRLAPCLSRRFLPARQTPRQARGRSGILPHSSISAAQGLPRPSCTVVFI